MNFEDMICSVCYTFPESPVETHCCGRIFCPNCLQELKRRQMKCPLCRSDIQYHQSKAIKRLLSQCNKDCQNCGKAILLKDYNRHQTICSVQQLPCKFCSLTLDKDDLLPHLNLLHQQDFLIDYKISMDIISKSKDRKCSKGHQLQPANSKQSYGCQRCKFCYSPVKQGSVLVCHICKQAECGQCQKNIKKKCQNSHPLQWKRTAPHNYFGNALCDLCREEVLYSSGYMHCSDCKFDLDRSCFNR